MRLILRFAMLQESYPHDRCVSRGKIDAPRCGGNAFGRILPGKGNFPLEDAMRPKTWLLAYVSVSVLMTADLSAQCGVNCPPFGVLDAFKVLDTNLTASVVREQPEIVNGTDVCTLQTTLWECAGNPLMREGFTIGTDAFGNVYEV